MAYKNEQLKITDDEEAQHELDCKVFTDFVEIQQSDDMSVIHTLQLSRSQAEQLGNWLIACTVQEVPA